MNVASWAVRLRLHLRPAAAIQPAAEGISALTTYGALMDPGGAPDGDRPPGPTPAGRRSRFFEEGCAIDPVSNRDLSRANQSLIWPDLTRWPLMALDCGSG
jgi:hypothetical protein